MEKESRAQKMGTMPVGKLLASMALPAMCSMLVQAMYNIVDSIFVAKISEDALTAVSLAFPMQMLILSFALGASVGANSLIARRLGEGRQQEASAAANNGFFLALVNYVIFLLGGLLLARPFISLFSEDPSLVEMGTQYLSIVMIFSFGMHIASMGEKVLQATGNMITPMITQLIGAITNIILDPIMIFGLFGFPALGIAGAAIATVIGQIASAVYVMVMLHIREHDVHIQLRGFRPDREAIRDILAVGVPTAVMNAIGSVTTTGMNKILMTYSSTAVAVIGAYFKLQSFVFMPVFGLTQGLMPILGYNYGANNRKRFMHALKLAFSVALGIMAVGTLLFNLIPDKLLMLFNAGAEMQKIGQVALRTISYCFIGAAFGIIISTMFQSIGHGFKSLLMSLLRQLILILPVAWLLGRTFGLDAVWFSYPVAEYICLVIFLPVGVWVIRREFERKAAQQGQEE
ncbi:MAG: MATE family efflux transporter [Provencibacterium sp.]|nr:MATE family efflux transporter [Provencibacterium sp.]